MCKLPKCKTLMLVFVSHYNRPAVTRIGAGLDGTISLRDGSGSEIWRLPTGLPIYSKYQAPKRQGDDGHNALETRFSLECGDDWGLYLIDHHGNRMVWLKEYILDCHVNALYKRFGGVFAFLIAAICLNYLKPRSLLYAFLS